MGSTVSQSFVSRSVFFTALRHPNYAKLLTGQVIAAFGDRINQTALFSIVVYVTGKTAKYSADIMFWAVLPAVVLGPFAMALIDRWNRQMTMVVSDVGRAVLAASLPLLMMWIHHHYAIYFVVFWMGAFTALFAPSRLAIMPNLVPRELLMSANAISSQAGTVATLVAMPIAGLIVEYCGREASFLLNAMTYLVSALFIWHLKPLSVTQESVFSSRHVDPTEDFLEGLRYIWRTRDVLFYVIFTGLVQCLVAISFVCFLTYGADVVGQNLGWKVVVINLLFGALGMGMAAGALWLGYFSALGERFSWPMIMMGGAGVGMFVLSMIKNPWMAGGVLFGIGFCAVMVMVPVDTFLQKHVPDGFRGRVFIARGVLVGTAFLISLQFSKAIIHQCGVLQTLKLVGLGSLILGFVSVWMGHRMCVNVERKMR